MKKHLTTLLLALLAMTGFAQNTGDIMYIYRNDGELNAFLRSEVQEISFSREDADGKSYDDIVTQLVVTEDSTYKIPLAVIDSIGFVTPATVYQPGVTEIAGDLLSYVDHSDSLTIYLNNAPESVLPSVGDKLVFTEMTEKFPAGFAGRVKSASTTVIECEALKLEEVFETFYSTTVTEGTQDGKARTRDVNAKGETSFRLPTWSLDFGAEFSKKENPMDNLAIKGGTKFEIALSPEFWVKTSLVINKAQGTNLSVDIKGDYDLQETVGLFAGMESSEDFLDKELVRAPVAPLTFFYVKPGVFVKASLIASLSAIWKQHFVSNTSLRFCSKALAETSLKSSAKMTSSDFDFEASIDGSIAAGGFVEVGVTFLSSDIDKLCLRGELGTELVGHFVLYNSDVKDASKSTKVYEALKSSDISWNVFLNTSFQAEMGPWGFSKNLPFNLNHNIAKWDIVPTFDNLAFEQCYSPRTSADAGMAVKGSLFEPREVGFKVFTDDGKEVGSWMSSEKYKKGGEQVSHKFEGLEDDGDYTLQPMVKYGPFDLLANPSVGIEKNDFPVRIVSFEQTGSHYSKQQGYEYDGKNYFYKFNAKTTVELSDKAENVKDWGYVYHDFYGVDKKISCANLGGRTYADERYAYYYNDPQRTVELSPYVQFSGEADIQKGKPKVFNVEYVHEAVALCPDENHPHTIDLGLASGTKWACCNVGAKTPQEYGEYYRWGETSPMGASYKFDEGGGNYTDLGSDIAGTKYDAATANWGGGWQMPNVDQLIELWSNCSIASVEYGEVGGFQLTGPNGNSIYLIASGAYEAPGKFHKKHETPYCVREADYGDYYHVYSGWYHLSNAYTPLWTTMFDFNYNIAYRSTGEFKYRLGESIEVFTKEMYDIYMEYGITENEWRTLGLTVRPVMKK